MRGAGQWAVTYECPAAKQHAHEGEPNEEFAMDAKEKENERMKREDASGESATVGSTAASVKTGSSLKHSRFKA